MAAVVLEDIREFFFTNGVVAMATAWGIGSVTRDFIHRILFDMLVPFYKYLVSSSGFAKLVQPKITNLLSQVGGPNMLRVAEVVALVAWDFMIWMTVIVLTFVMLEYVLNRGLIGLKTRVKDDSKHTYDKSRVSGVLDVCAKTLSLSPPP